MDLWQERTCCTGLSESRNRAAPGKHPSLHGKSLPCGGRRPVEAQTDQLSVPTLSVGEDAIEFVVDTGAAVSLIHKGGLVKSLYWSMGLPCLYVGVET